MCITVVSAPAGKAGRSVEERRDYERFASKYNFGINTSTEKTAAVHITKSSKRKS